MAIHKFSNAFIDCDSCCDQPIPKRFMDHINDLSLYTLSSDSIQLWNKIKKSSNGR